MLKGEIIVIVTTRICIFVYEVTVELHYWSQVNYFVAPPKKSPVSIYENEKWAEKAKFSLQYSTNCGQASYHQLALRLFLLK